MSPIRVFREHTPPPPGAPPGRRSVVFVHGVFSTSEDAFVEMKADFDHDGRFDGWELAGFDYDFNQPLTDSGNVLLRALTTHFGGGDRVVLVCHSMGGLVARLAVMGHRLPFVMRIVMLATPNFGVLRTSQMGLLATFAVSAAGRLLWGLFPRKAGLRDLSRIEEVFAPHVTDPQSVANAAAVEYVTIPGTYFHPSRKDGFFGERETDAHWMLLFSTLNLGAEVWNSFTPSLMNVKIDRPNDGLVEETSNRLDPVTDPGRFSEKMRAISGQALPNAAVTYAHVRPTVCDRLNHVTLQHDPQVIGHVKDLVLADNLGAWLRQVPAAGGLFYKIDSY